MPRTTNRDTTIPSRRPRRSRRSLRKRSRISRKQSLLPREQSMISRRRRFPCSRSSRKTPEEIPKKVKKLEEKVIELEAHLGSLDWAKFIEDHNTEVVTFYCLIVLCWSWTARFDRVRKVSR
jgi:hypothetical protein